MDGGYMSAKVLSYTLGYKRPFLEMFLKADSHYTTEVDLELTDSCLLPKS